MRSDDADYDPDDESLVGYCVQCWAECHPLSIYVERCARCGHPIESDRKYWPKLLPLAKYLRHVAG